MRNRPYRILSILIALTLPAATIVAIGAEAPEIVNVQIREVGDDYAAITWETSEPADSMVNYGLSNNYGIERDPLADKKAHGVVLTKLKKNTTYHFRVVSSDEEGNQSVSGDFTFTTTGYEDIPQIEEVQQEEQKALVGQVVDALDQITDEAALAIIEGKLQSVVQDTVRPLNVLGVPRVEDITAESAVVRWVTNRPANSLVALAPESDYDETRSDPYTLTQGHPDERVTEHRVELIGLEPATRYHIRVLSEDDLGTRGSSEDVTFRTKSHLPAITGIQVVKTEETSATIAWSTSLPAAGEVRYTDTVTGQTRSQGSPEFTLSHTVRLSDLSFGTRYMAVVVVKNRNGEEVRSDEFSFVTVRDEAPPIISKVTNESTLYPGSQTKIQTVVGWRTDEPASCTFKYVQGLAGTEPTAVESSKEYKTEHVQVVVEFQPATVYKFWIECEDAAGNEARSEDFVLFTPAKEKSILDIIIENFEGSFGWIKNIGK